MVVITISGVTLLQVPLCFAVSFVCFVNVRACLRGHRTFLWLKMRHYGKKNHQR